MKALKEYIEKNNIRNVAFHRFYRSIVLDQGNSTTAGAFDVVYIHKYLVEECGLDPVIISMKDENVEGFNVQSYDQVDYSKLDLIIFQPYGFTMFGGIWAFKELDSVDVYTEKFNGETMVIYNDPNIPWTNPYKIITNEKKTKMMIDKDVVEISRTEEHVKAFEEKKCTALFIGRDFEKFKENFKRQSETRSQTWPSSSLNIRLTEWIMKNELSKSSSALFSEEKDVKRAEFDIFYYGSNRGGSRSKNLKKLFKNDEILNKLWIGYDPEYNRTTVLPKQNHKDLVRYADQCVASLVIGDDSHNDNIITYRVFENAIMEIPSVVYNEYDSNHIIFPSEEYRDLTYFSTIEDLISIIEKLKDQKTYQKVLKYQKDRIIELSNEYDQPY